MIAKLVVSEKEETEVVEVLYFEHMIVNTIKDNENWLTLIL